MRVFLISLWLLFHLRALSAEAGLVTLQPSVETIELLRVCVVQHPHGTVF